MNNSWRGAGGPFILLEVGAILGVISSGIITILSSLWVFYLECYPLKCVDFWGTEHNPEGAMMGEAELIIDFTDREWIFS